MPGVKAGADRACRQARRTPPGSIAATSITCQPGDTGAPGEASLSSTGAVSLSPAGQHQAESGQQRRLGGRPLGIGVKRAAEPGRGGLGEYQAVLGVRAAQDDPVALAKQRRGVPGRPRSRAGRLPLGGTGGCQPSRSKAAVGVSRTGASASVTGRSNPSATGPLSAGRASGMRSPHGLSSSRSAARLG